MPIEFYKITSQILPLLFLAMTLQSVFIVRKVTYQESESAQKDYHILFFVFTLFLLLTGEFVSLKAVYLNSPGKWDLLFVALIMVLGAFWIIVEYILGLLGKSKEMYIYALYLLGAVFIAFVFLSI